MWRSSWSYAGLSWRFLRIEEVTESIEASSESETPESVRWFGQACMFVCRRDWSGVSLPWDSTVLEGGLCHQFMSGIGFDKSAGKASDKTLERSTS